MSEFITTSELELLRSAYRSPDEDPASIQNSPFIYILYSANQSELAPFFEERRCLPGEIIVREETPGDSMFLVLSGTAVVIKGEFSTPTILGFRAVGSILGEMALLENRPRSASVVAMDELALLSMNREKFFQFLKSYPEVEQSIRKMLDAGLHSADDLTNQGTLNEKRLLKMVQELEDEKQELEDEKQELKDEKKRLDERKALYDKANEIIAALHEQAIRDPLTGLFNRRYMEETLQREISRARRGKIPVSVIMLDIDFFKSINDTYGHRAGDLVLQNLARLLQNSVRMEDVTCRYGGEEFCVVMPGASLEIACRRAEAIRVAFLEMRVKYEEHTIAATLSLGAATYIYDASKNSQDGQNRDEDIIARADKALYQAKQSGRNRMMYDA